MEWGSLEDGPHNAQPAFDRGAAQGQLTPVCTYSHLNRVISAIEAEFCSGGRVVIHTR